MTILPIEPQPKGDPLDFRARVRVRALLAYAMDKRQPHRQRVICAKLIRFSLKDRTGRYGGKPPVYRITKEQLKTNVRMSIETAQAEAGEKEVRP